MNFSQLHERLRLLALRRIDNGSLNSALLARQIGCSAAHVSNFLNRKRRLSLDALDKFLQAQFLTIADLYPEGPSPGFAAARGAAAMSFDAVPLVDARVAVAAQRVPSDAIVEVVRVRGGLLGALRDRCSAERRRWDRFLAVQVSEEEAVVMHPVLRVNAIALIDRHYNSIFPYHPGRRNIYAVRLGGRLRFRYVAMIEKHIVFTAHNPAHLPELLPPAEAQTPTEALIGRVFLVIVEI